MSTPRINAALVGYGATPPSSSNPFATHADVAALGSGTVTSVAATVPTGFSVGGSPVTTAGTLAISLDAQAANKVLASPTTGSAAVPAFRALVAADVPALAYDASGAAAAAQAASLPLHGTADLAASANALASATTTVAVSAATAPTSGQVLTATSGTAATWQTPTSGLTQPQVLARQSFGGF